MNKEEKKITYLRWVKQVFPDANSESMTVVTAIIPRELARKLESAYGISRMTMSEYDFSLEEWFGMLYCWGTNYQNLKGLKNG